MMRIGFCKKEITPPVGTELGGYAGFRPCTGVHDSLWCKAVVLEQEGVRYALVAFDLLCVDEGMYLHLAKAVEPLGVEPGRLIACAIHSHASPLGLIPGEGPLARVNRLSIDPEKPDFADYIHEVIRSGADACREAAESLETFQVRTARGIAPPVGSERHTGAAVESELTVLQIRTDSGKNLILYNFPCHPTVLSGANLQVSADFAAGIEGYLAADMAVFLNGAAGDISTRFTRREQSFGECDRMAAMAAQGILTALEGAEFTDCQPLKGLFRRITLQPRQVGTPDAAQRKLEELAENWKTAQAAGVDAGTLRILRSYVEGAGVNLQFAHALEGVSELTLPVTVFSFGAVKFAAIPGELFSTLKPPGAAVIAYANGYYRYIAGCDAYDLGYYEALASILEQGQGERLMDEVNKLLKQLDDM